MASTPIDAKKVKALRDEGVSWQKIADQLGDGTTAFGIRCREALYRLDVAEGRIEKIKATPGNVRALREKGAGWALIATKAGITVGEAKKLAAKADGMKVAKHDLTGRNYVRADGTINHSPGAAVVAAERKAAMDEAADEVEAPAATEEAPAKPKRRPRRRRSAAKAA